MLTPSVSRRTLLGGTMAAAVASAFTPFGPAAYADPAPAGYLAYTSNGILYRSNADGSGAEALTIGSQQNLAWMVDGSRLAFTSNGSGSRPVGIWTVRPDGSMPVRLTIASQDIDLTSSTSGRFVYFSRDGRIMSITADGTWLRGPLFDYDALGPTVQDRHPTLATGKPILFDRRINGAAPGIYKYVSFTQADLLIPNAKDPEYSPDGTKLVYLTSNASNEGLEVWTANADGTGAARLGTDSSFWDVTWAPDGLSVYVTQTGFPAAGIKKIDVTTGELLPVVGEGQFPALQPIRNSNRVIRAWGQTALDTAIAISRFNWPDHDSTDPNWPTADAVVISRSDAFYDALAGSALAAKKNAPLLITPQSGLYPGAEAEIQRVLGPSGLVYILGGPAAVPTAIENRITSLGYTVKRLGGQDMFGTALAINNEITTTPDFVIISTGVEFYDALAAGAAAAGFEKTVLVLTNGDTMPTTSAAYLNNLNPDDTLMVTAGGPGDRALVSAYQGGQLPNWPNNISYLPLVGDNAMDTAVLLARDFFAGPQIVAVATMAGWYDALTGGAMIGNNYGPLLLTPPNSLDAGVAEYLNENSGNVSVAVVLGGTAALPASIQAPIGTQIGLPNGYTYEEVTPETLAASQRSAAAKGAPVAKAKEASKKASLAPTAKLAR